jgi:hypothetical protein
MPVSRSYFSGPHARDSDRMAPRTLTANIRRRRGSKVAINLPLFIDERTPRPFVDPTIPWQRDIYPEDPGEFSSILLVPASELMDLAIRGKTGCRSHRPYLHGRHGLWYGLQLSAADLPGV